WERGSTSPHARSRRLVARVRVPGVREPEPSPPQNPSRSSAGEPLADNQSNVRDLGDVPSIEVISRAAVMLMSAAAEKLGLAHEDPHTAPKRDLDEARRLIAELDRLVTASAAELGPHRGPQRRR